MGGELKRLYITPLRWWNRMPVSYIEEIRKSIERRRKAKNELDEAISLSNMTNGSYVCLSTEKRDSNIVRMLDEGAIMDDYDNVRLYIEKGAIQRFYDSLDEDYIGYVNLAHIPLDSLPLPIGQWKKEDLVIVEKDDGRTGLDANIHIYDDLNIVQDLRKVDMPLSVSVEMYPEYDLEMSEKLDMPVVKDLFIAGVSVVGNPANVDSSEIRLGEENMSLKEILAKVSSNEEKLEDAIEEESHEEEVQETEEVVEETVEEVAEATEEQEEIEEVEETVEEETLEDEISNDDMQKLEAYINELQSQVESLTQENESLRAQVESLTKENTDLNANVSGVLNKVQNLMNDQKEVAHEEPKDSIWG